jgi:hypothetical protein
MFTHCLGEYTSISAPFFLPKKKGVACLLLASGCRSVLPEYRVPLDVLIIIEQSRTEQGRVAVTSSSNLDLSTALVIIVTIHRLVMLLARDRGCSFKL